MVRTPRHTTHYLECGPADGSLMMFLHGWPELSLIWRAQLEAFAADGWHCVAPDMRGYGGFSAPAATEAYTNEQVVTDMAEFHDHLGSKPAIWIGHDWGSVIVGAMLAHHPERSRGAVLVSVPYFPTANALPTLVSLVDRRIYPADEYPDGQWDYYRYYTTHFAAAVADLDADKAASLASIYRRADPASMGKVAANALVTRKGGRFGAKHRAPPTQPDLALWPEADFHALVQAFEIHGFGSPCAWYLNDDANIAYMRRARKRRPHRAAGIVHQRRPRPDEQHRGQSSRRSDAGRLRRSHGDEPCRCSLAPSGAKDGACPGDSGMASDHEARVKAAAQGR